MSYDPVRGHATAVPRSLSRLLDRVGDGLHVEGLERDQVDDLAVDPLLRQLLGRLQRGVPHPAVGQDGDVAAGAGDLGALQGLVVAVDGLALDVVEQHVLEEDDRVVRTDCRLEQRLGDT